MKKRNVLNSPRLLELKKKKQKVFVNKIYVSAFAVVVLFAFAAYVSRLPSVNISTIEVSGNKVVDADAIKTDIQADLAGHYFWLFPKSSILLYPRNRIKNELLTQFKRLKDITLSIKDGKTLEVTVSERTASYTWCGTSLTTGEKCYFMDENGYVFDEAPYFSGEVYFKFYGPAVVGNYFSQTNFKQLISFKNTLVAMGLKPVSLSLIDDQNIKIYLSNGNSISAEPYITFKSDADLQSVAENLQTAITTEPLQSLFKNKYSTLQYIDLRFGNKVYYKFN